MERTSSIPRTQEPSTTAVMKFNGLQAPQAEKGRFWDPEGHKNSLTKQEYFTRNIHATVWSTSKELG